MLDFIVVLMDLPTKQSYPQIQDPVEIVLEVELPKYDHLGIDQEVMEENLRKLSKGTGLAESSLNPKAESDKEGNAKGYYQWLTEVPKTKENPEGIGQPAFQTALNRGAYYYEVSDKKIPSWILDARQHNDPTKLSQRQQDALFYADIFQRKGTTTEFGEGYEQGKLQEIMKTGSPDIMNKIYLDNWHTDPNQAVIDNARRSFY